MAHLPIKQAGAIVFRVTRDGPEILLIRANKNRSHWIFPKGHVEKGESLEQTALRETLEESGMHVRALGRIGAPLRFRTKDEWLTVQYFLARADRETGGRPPRDLQWLAPEPALATVTHDDARALLEEALPSIREEAALAAASAARPDAAFTELVLAEYGHVADSLLRNEEDGEKRVTFFMTLTGAIGTALAFLVPPETLDPASAHPLVAAALSVVLIVGYLTLVRVVHRNLASERYKRSLNRIRRHFVPDHEDPRRAVLAFDPFVRAQRAPPSSGSLGRGGWLETVALVESIVAGALAASVVPTPDWGTEALVCAFTALVAWLLLIHDARRRYRAEARQH